MDELLFHVTTPLGITIIAARRYWELVIAEKHPVLRGCEEEVRIALEDPDQVRRSRKDPAVLLFYRGEFPRWLCAVAKVSGRRGFLITAYPTDAIKIGELVWPRLH